MRLACEHCGGSGDGYYATEQCDACEGSGNQKCDTRGCTEDAVGFDEDGATLCEDCLFERQSEASNNYR